YAENRALLSAKVYLPAGGHY
ncbi:hypothetical protein EVA_15465, partial [gut metagenome]